MRPKPNIRPKFSARSAEIFGRKFRPTCRIFGQVKKCENRTKFGFFVLHLKLFTGSPNSFWYVHNWNCNLNCKRNMIKELSNTFCSILATHLRRNWHYFRPNIRPKVSANVAEYSVSAETRFFRFGRTLIFMNFCTFC